ncbi:MAG TPA: AAA family ATPase [Planctomycetota bacterium]|nr:AAA family ATPase [Planctomycetota bacterium]
MAVGGGKGGVGKTFLCANLAAAVAGAGWRVIAVDTDIEGANLHTWLGVDAPPVSLADYVAGREHDVAKLVVDTPIPGLKMIAATHGNLAAAQPDAARRAELLRGLRQLPCDFVFLDCGAGSHLATVDYFLVGDEGILVMHPEPTSVENAYAFLRAAFYRRLQLAMQKHDVRDRVREAMDQRNARGIRTPLDLMREVEAMDPEEGRRFAATLRSFRPRIVVNEVASAEDVKLGFSVRSVCQRFFGLDVEYLGYINRDDAVREAVLRRRPLPDVRQHSDAAVYLKRIARKLLEGYTESSR